MTEQQHAILLLQDDAIGFAERVLYGPAHRSRGRRADLASDAFWLLTGAMCQSRAHLETSFRCEREGDGDLSDEAIAGGLRRCIETRHRSLRLF